MAPEQARGEETGPKSDVFALGAVLYFLLTGAAPFAAKTMRDALQRAEQCEFDRQALGQCKSQSLAKICRMTMDSEPPARPTASDLAGQLERCATAQPWRKFALAGVAAAVLLIACVGIWRIGMPWGDSDSPSVAPTGPTVPQSDPTQPVDLLATVRLSRDAPLVEGLTEGSHWTLEEGVLAGFAPPGGHALLQFAALPTEPRNDEQTQVNNVNGRFEYRLDMEVAADASSTLVAIPIVLPNGQLMLKLQDDRLWLEEYERPKVIEESKYLVALGDNASHTISIDVVGEEQSARIVVRFDKRHVFEWDGLYRLVSDDRRDERSHGLLVGSGAARFSRVDLSSTQLPKAQQHYRDGLAKLSHSAGDQPATAAAIDEFTAAIQQDDAFAAAFRERGLARMQQADFGKALADLNETLKLTPRDATAWLIRGRIHAAQGDLEEALSDFDESIALDPSLAPAHKQRGQVLLRLERWDEAGASLYRWIDLAPHDRGPLEITDAVRAKLPPVDELSWRPASEVDWASSPGVQFLRGQFYPDKIESDPRRLSTVFFGRGAPASLVPDDPEGHVSFHLRKSDAQTVELGLRVEPPPGYQLKAPAGNEKHPPVRIDFTPGNYRLHEVELAKPDVKQDERYNSEVLVAEFEHSAVYVWQIEAERLPTEISGNLAYIMATDMMTRRLTEEFRLPLDGHRLAIRNTTAAPVQVYLNDVWNLPRFRTSLAAYQLAELETYPGQIWTFKQFGREIDFYQATGEPDQQAQAAFSGMPVRIAIGPDGIRSTSGLSADQERQARSFFDQLELPEERLVIYVRRQTTGHLQWEIEGQIDAALEQRIREVLAGLL